MEACSCSKCVKLCQNPGWMTPQDAKAAIDAGHAERLMVDYWIRAEGNIFVLCPASAGHEASRAPNTDELFGHMSMSGQKAGMRDLDAKGTCTFLESGKCLLHETAFKPRQCRECYGCKDVGPDNTEMALTWDSPEAQALVREWMTTVGLSEDTLEECT